jgi:hypothetical protein
MRVSGSRRVAIGSGGSVLGRRRPGTAEERTSASPFGTTQKNGEDELSRTLPTIHNVRQPLPSALQDVQPPAPPDLRRLQSVESVEGEELDIPGAFPDPQANEKRNRRRLRIGTGNSNNPISNFISSNDLPRIPTSSASNLSDATSTPASAAGQYVFDPRLPHTPSLLPQTPLAASLSSSSNLFDSPERALPLPPPPPPPLSGRSLERNPHRKRSDSAPLPSSTSTSPTLPPESAPGDLTSPPFAFDDPDSASAASFNGDQQPYSSNAAEFLPHPLRRQQRFDRNEDDDEEEDEEEEFLVDEDILEDDEEYLDDEDEFDDAASGSRPLRIPGLDLSSLVVRGGGTVSDGEVLAIGREEDMLESFRGEDGLGGDQEEPALGGEGDDGGGGRERRLVEEVGEGEIMKGVNGGNGDEGESGLQKSTRSSLAPPIIPPYTFAPILVQRLNSSSSLAAAAPAKPSALSLLFTSHSASPSPPPFQPYSRVLLPSSSSDPSLSLSLYFPHSKAPTKPIKCRVSKTATVEEVVGVGLYLFEDDEGEGRAPKLEVGFEEGKVGEVEWGVRMSTVGWSLRIVEDDGEVDEDFPG